jgi:hypothetical protein
MSQKEFNTLLRVESLGDSRRFMLCRHTSVGCTAAQMLSLLLVDASCSWRAPSAQNNAGIEAMNGCSPLSSFVAAGLQHLDPH